jgi:phosphotransferase family enzyme
VAPELTNPLPRSLRPPASLPQLDTVLDLDVMLDWLRELAPLASDGGLVVSSARLIESKEGDRALVAYELERPAGGARFRVFGKLFGDLVQAKRAREVQLALWTQVFHHDTRLGVPEPIGWLPELSLVLYLPVAGQHLDDAILAGVAGDPLQEAAEWLVCLHESRLRLDRRLDLGNEFVSLARWADAVGRADPNEASRAAQILESLREAVVGIDFETGLPVHKDFHYRHVVVGNRLAVIDFDEMRYGDPSLDLAHFCTYLRLLCIRLGWPPSRFLMLEQPFLDAYASGTGWVRDERFAFFSAYTCLKIAWQLSAAVGVPPSPTGAERRRQVRAILEHGQALGASLA